MHVCVLVCVSLLGGAAHAETPAAAPSPVLSPAAAPSTSATQLVGVSVAGTPVVSVGGTVPSVPVVGSVPPVEVSVPIIPTVPTTPTIPITVAPTPAPSTPTTPPTPTPTTPIASNAPTSSATAPASGSSTSSPSSTGSAAVHPTGDDPGGQGLAGSSSSVSAGAPRANARRQAQAQARARRRPVSHVSTAGVGAHGAIASTRALPNDGSPRPPAQSPHARARAGSGTSSGNPLESIGRHIPLPLPVPDWSKPIILVLLLLAIWFGVRSGLAGRRARRLEGQRAGLLADMEVMQAALVPAVPASLGGLAVSVAYRPAEGPAAGGDFYDLFEPAPGRVAVILGDVAGHGHEALTQAALTRYTLRAYIQAGLEPRAALALAGRVLSERSPGEHFATVAAGVYDKREATLTYALAGHPPPILRGVPGWEPITICSSPPLGCGLPTGRRQSIVSLPAGVEVCFFSDGLIEARCPGPEEESGLLGRERLEEMLDELGPRPVAEDLLAQVRAAAQATPDDMAACILTPRTPAGGAPAYVGRARPQVEELEVNEWALVAGHVQRFLGACGLSAPEVVRTIELATATATVSHTALLRIERFPAGATATVSSPAPGVPSLPSEPYELYLEALNASAPGPTPSVPGPAVV
jgi:serine phosphatase RsbU (regulator of sigma subunit)